MGCENIIFDPENRNSNIHGVVGTDGNATCLTADGITRCTGCCNGLDIEIKRKIVKERGVNCSARVPKKGCGHVINSTQEQRYEPICSAFHCSSQVDNLKNNSNDNEAFKIIYFCNEASFLSGEIDKETRNENLKRLGI